MKKQNQINFLIIFNISKMKSKSKSQEKGIFYLIAWYVNVCLSIFFTAYLMRQIAYKRFKPILVTSINQFYSLMSIYLIIHILLLNIFQLLPCKENIFDRIRKCLQNSINNCILYLIIFACLAFYQGQNEVYTNEEILQLAQLFITGRILFTFGYLLGTCLNAQFLRSYGFGLCIASLVSLFSSISKINFINIFK